MKAHCTISKKEVFLIVREGRLPKFRAWYREMSKLIWEGQMWCILGRREWCRCLKRRVTRWSKSTGNESRAKWICLNVKNCLVWQLSHSIQHQVQRRLPNECWERRYRHQRRGWRWSRWSRQFLRRKMYRLQKQGTSGGSHLVDKLHEAKNINLSIWKYIMSRKWNPVH